MGQDMKYKVLFRDSKPISPDEVKLVINAFGASYTRTIRRIILDTIEIGQKNSTAF